MYENTADQTNRYGNSRGFTRPATPAPYQPELDDRQGNVYDEGVPNYGGMTSPSRAAVPPPSSPNSPTDAAPKAPRVEVLNLKMGNGNGPTVAYGTVKIGLLEIRNCRLVHPSGKSAFSAVP